MLSAQLPRLSVLANRIVGSKTLRSIRLRGVNRSGLEYASSHPPGFLSNAGISSTEFDEIAAWGANVVRVPFNQSRALHTPDHDPDSYLASMDSVVSLAAERGMYTLFDLQWLDAIHPRGHLSNGSPNFVPPLPNLASLEVWSQLARRYRDEPGVLYDLFNEPHDALPDDPVPLHGITPAGALFPLTARRVRFSDWKAWALHLANAIRSQNPHALLFISGIDWGYDLRGFPLSEIPNAVYSSHVYPHKSKPWRAAFGHLAQTAPVFIAEWGGGEQDLAWGRKLLNFLDDRELGWTAWSWSDHPHIVKPAAAFEPTVFGELVRQSLRDLGVC